ncbi:uncharacterized protein LOC135112080 [Scylla paramamosain]|uniref:uncharacterized protein LOC135112080 n=1 Tax=Scylla paramamosain TaxID=85552 RepID=UPI0030834CA5
MYWKPSLRQFFLTSQHGWTTRTKMSSTTTSSSISFKEFTISVSAWLRHLLNLRLTPLGDTTAHAAWNEMQALATLLEHDSTTDKPQRVDLLWELWLQRLPSSVRAALHEADDCPVEELINKVDNLINTAKASCAPDTICPALVDNLPNTNAARPPVCKWLPDNQTCNCKPGVSSQHGQHGLCYYHHKFGAGACKCTPGCQWPKNC